MNFLTCHLLVLAISVVLSSISCASEPLTLSGVVYLDLNKNGLKDKGEKGLGNIYLSNGIDFIKSDKDGRYSLAVDKEIMPFIFVIKPARYSGIKSLFHFCEKAKKDDIVNFGLEKHGIGNELELLQISDLHFPFFTAKAMNNIAVPVIDKLIKDAKDSGADFIVNTGDTANQGRESQFKALAKAFSRFNKFTIYNVVGNHDFNRGKGNKKYNDLSPYFKYIGQPNYYSFNYGKMHFVALDSCREKDEVEKAQQEWLKKDLEIFGHDKQIVILTHSNNICRRPEYKKILSPYSVLLTLSGHLHRNHIWKENGSFNVSASMFFHSGRGAPLGSYQKVQIKDSKVKAEIKFSGPVKNRGGDVSSSVGSSAKISLSSDWPMFQGDAKHNGIAKDALKPPLSLAWVKKCANHFNVISPIIVNKKIILGISNQEKGKGGILCLDENGDELWRFKCEFPVRQTPASGEGIVCFYSSVGNLYGLKLENGKLIWKTTAKQTETPYFRPLTIKDGLIYGVNGWSIEKIDLLTGKRISSAGGSGWGWASCISPTIADGKVFHSWGTPKGLLCFDEKAKKLWEFKEKNSFSNSSPVYYRNKIFWAVNSTLYALDSNTGKILWSFLFTPHRYVYPRPLSTPCVKAGVLYIGSLNDGKLYALNLDTGKKIWEYQTGRSILPYGGAGDPYLPSITGSPVVSGSVVYIGAHDGYLHAVDAKTGKGIWSRNIGTPITSSPAISGNSVIVTGLNGKVYAFSGVK